MRRFGRYESSYTMLHTWAGIGSMFKEHIQIQIQIFYCCCNDIMAWPTWRIA